jgi:hypothetical protein
MRSPACSTSSAPPGQSAADPKVSPLADRAYQGWTVAAMLLLLATLWLFW